MHANIYKEPDTRSNAATIYNNLIKKSFSHDTMHLSAHILSNILRADLYSS